MTGPRPHYRIEEHLEGALILMLGKQFIRSVQPLGITERRRHMGEMRRLAEEHAGVELDWHRAQGKQERSSWNGGCVVIWTAPSWDTYTTTQEEVA